MIIDTLFDILIKILPQTLWIAFGAIVTWFILRKIFFKLDKCIEGYDKLNAKVDNLVSVNEHKKDIEHLSEKLDLQIAHVIEMIEMRNSLKRR